MPGVLWRPKEMRDFLLALLFSKVILLTPHPVSVEGRIELVPAEPLTAISSGAELEIDVTSMVPNESKKRLFEFWDKAEAAFPAGVISAELVDRAGHVVSLKYQGHSSISNDDIRLILDNGGEISTKAEYVKVVIDSRIPLKNVSVYWRNYKK